MVYISRTVDAEILTAAFVRKGIHKRIKKGIKQGGDNDGQARPCSFQLSCHHGRLSLKSMSAPPSLPVRLSA